MRYSAKPGNPSKSSIRQIKLYSVAVKTAVSVLLPFVPVLKNGGNPTVVQQALHQLRADQQWVELESLLAFFASFVLEGDVVRQIMRWDMAVLRESPWYQEILREGERLGEQKGREAGRNEGRMEGRNERLHRQRSLILKQLTRRVGDLAPAMIDQIQALSLEQVEALGEALLDFSQPQELLTWLERHQNP